LYYGCPTGQVKKSEIPKRDFFAEPTVLLVVITSRDIDISVIKAFLRLRL
jgi:hypothetical protein